MRWLGPENLTFGIQDLDGLGIDGRQRATVGFRIIRKHGRTYPRIIMLD